MLCAYLNSTASKQCNRSQMTTCRVCTCMKNKLPQNFPGLRIPHKVNEKEYFSDLYVTHCLLALSVTSNCQRLL